MKLYNLFEDIILEVTNEGKNLLTENVSREQVEDAINNKYYVNILYDDFPDGDEQVPPSKRYIQVYNFSDTTANNAAIRAYQMGGPSKTTPDQGAWKIFRLDRIRAWMPTKMKFHRPMDKFNPNGDRSMSKVHNIATFNDIGPSKYVRKSVDITPDYLAQMSPEERAKYDASVKRSREKNTIKKPNGQSSVQPKEPSQMEPTKPDSSYIVPNDQNGKDDETKAYLAMKAEKHRARNEKLKAQIQKDKEREKAKKEKLKQQELQQRLQQKLNDKNKNKNISNDTTSNRP